ncbi:MAG: RecX family transcriptional regulator, partial [Eubacteriales bacterium]|nr:RecX family transcriptional regulator [Eubacteriales bacterium]
MNIEYIVTDIKEITGRRRLIGINFEPAFALYPAEIRRFNIKKEAVISEKDYTEITEGILSKRAKSRAMNLLKSKDYTVFELSKKLKDAYYPDTAIEAAVKYVSSYGYLNDYRYAESYVSFKADNKSRKQIETFLYNKGVDASLIKQVCDN